MAFSIRGKVSGLEDAISRLNAVKLGVRNKLLRKGTGKGCRLVSKSAKAKCPINTDPHLEVKGLLKKAIGGKVKTTKRGSIIGLIGPRRGFRTKVGTVRSGPKTGQAIYQDPANIAALVELGHSGPAPAPPRPYMRPAWDETSASVLGVYRDVLSTGIAALGLGRTVDDGGSFDEW